MDRPLFSIVTATRNAAKELQRTAASLAAQQWIDFEWIVIDGDSTDETKSLLPTLYGVSDYVSEPDRGIADAWNKGIERASGRQVLVLNAGDIYDADMLRILAPLVDDEHVTCCHARLSTEDGRPAGEFRSHPGRLWRGMHLAHNWCAVPRHLYMSRGLYKPMPHAMDYEWFYGYFRERGLQGFTVVDRVLGTYHLGGHSDMHAAAGFAANEKIWMESGRSALVSRLLRLAYTARHILAQTRRKA